MDPRVNPRTKPGDTDDDANGGSISDAVKSRDLFQVHGPAERGAAPVLTLRRELSALADGAEPQIVGLRLGHGARIDRRPAVGAERVDAPAAALGRFDVFPGFAGHELEGRARRRHHGPIGRAGQLLAVRAMADRDLFRIDDGLVSDRAAVTPAV